MKTQPIQNMTTVEIFGTQSYLDGIIGEVTGVAFYEVSSGHRDYIVTFTDVLYNGYNSIVITMHCIKVI